MLPNSKIRLRSKSSEQMVPVEKSLALLELRHWEKMPKTVLKKMKISSQKLTRLNLKTE
jgi:hypothetical protein